MDQSVCVVLAAFLCSFLEPDGGGTGKLLRPYNDSRDASAFKHVTRPDKYEIGSLPYKSEQGTEDTFLASGQANSAEKQRLIRYQEAQGDSSLSKAVMRQQLAFISHHYPIARPSRGNLKEVFNFARVYLSSLESGND